MKKWLIIALIVAMSTISTVHAAVDMTLLNAVTVTGASAAVDASGFNYKGFHVIISAGTATVKIQADSASAFGNPIDVTSVTASSWISTNDQFGFLRANVTACAGCTVTVKAFMGN
jgi:hypothetical protein